MPKGFRQLSRGATQLDAHLVRHEQMPSVGYLQAGELTDVRRKEIFQRPPYFVSDLRSVDTGRGRKRDGRERETRKEGRKEGWTVAGEG